MRDWGSGSRAFTQGTSARENRVSPAVWIKLEFVLVLPLPNNSGNMKGKAFGKAFALVY